MAASKSWNVEKLNNSNYETWKFQMKMTLIHDELWTVIDGAVPAEKDQVESWTNKNLKALSTIALCVEKSQYPLIKDCVFAKDAWKKLESFHIQKSFGTKFSLLRKAISKRMRPDQDVTSFLLEFDELFDKMSNYDDLKLSEIWKAGFVLESLPESYDMLVMALEARPESELTLEFVKQKILDEANRKKDAAVSRNLDKVEHAMAATRIKPTCWHCGKPGHKKTECPELLKKDDDSDSSGERKISKKTKGPTANFASKPCSKAYAMMSYVETMPNEQLAKADYPRKKLIGNGSCKKVFHVDEMQKRDDDVANGWTIVTKRNWTCCECKYINFAKRIQCRKCCGYKQWKRDTSFKMEGFDSGGAREKVFHM